MGLRAFVLLPTSFKDSELKFLVETYNVIIENSEVVLDIIKINCSSCSLMLETVDDDLYEVIKRPFTEKNITEASYLSMMQMLLWDVSEENFIPDNIVQILNMCGDNRDINSNSGYYFLFDDEELKGIEQTLRLCIGY